MRWFGGKAAREGARPALSRAGSVLSYGDGGAGAWPQGYEAQVREGYRRNPVAQRAVKLQPSLAAGQPATLLGYPVVEAEDMPDVAAGSLSIAFGNFRMGYLIAERSETAILRDPYSNKPFVGFSRPSGSAAASATRRRSS